jgi:acetyl esterase/lipase
MIQFPDDEFILMGDSAGGLVILSAYQLFNQQEQSSIKRIILLSPWLDFSLSNPKMKDIEKNDFMLAVDQFNGLNAYDDISQTMQFQSPMDFQYDKPIDIYVGTYDILYPDTCLFEERNPDVNLMIFEKHPHVFALLPMKKAKIVTQKMIETINNL